jgi:hypothetical protein
MRSGRSEANVRLRLYPGLMPRYQAGVPVASTSIPSIGLRISTALSFIALAASRLLAGLARLRSPSLAHTSSECLCPPATESTGQVGYQEPLYASAEAL